MYRFKNLMVSLTAGNQDEAKIRFAGLISRLANSEAITFVHVLSTQTIREKSQEEYNLLKHNNYENIKHHMRDIVNRYFSESQNMIMNFDVFEENAEIEKKILQAIREKDIDLRIIGKIKREPTKEGTIPLRLVRKAPCSVLLIPEGIRPDLTHILVPVDFSNHSKLAIEVAIAFASAYETSDIRCLHVHSNTTREYAEKAFRKFINTCNFGNISVTHIIQTERKPYRAIEDFVKEHHIDLLVIGAKGQSNILAPLIGSTTENLIARMPMPMLAVKNKHENIRYLDDILDL